MGMRHSFLVGTYIIGIAFCPSSLCGTLAQFAGMSYWLRLRWNGFGVFGEWNIGSDVLGKTGSGGMVVN